MRIPTVFTHIGSSFLYKSIVNDLWNMFSTCLFKLDWSTTFKMTASKSKSWVFIHEPDTACTFIPHLSHSKFKARNSNILDIRANPSFHIQWNINSNQTLVCNLNILILLLIKLRVRVKSLLNHFVPILHLWTVFVLNYIWSSQRYNFLETYHKYIRQKVLFKWEQPLSDIHFLHRLDTADVPGADIHFEEVNGCEKTFLFEEFHIDEVL